MKNLIVLYREYIKFLEDEINRNAGFLNNHGMYPTREDIDKGKELREKIKEAENKLL